MGLADPNLSPEPGPHRRPRFAMMNGRLGRRMHSDDPTLTGYRIEIVAILDALETLNRAVRGIRTRSRPGDVELD